MRKERVGVKERKGKKSDEGRRILTMRRRADLSREVDPFPLNVKFLSSSETIQGRGSLISSSMTR